MGEKKLHLLVLVNANAGDAFGALSSFEGIENIAVDSIASLVKFSLNF